MEKKKNKSLTKTNKKTSNDKKEKKITIFFKRFIEVLKKKWLVNTSTTLLLVLIIFAIYVGGTTILEKVTIPDIDCTTNKIHTLSDETKSRLKDLDKEVKITLVNYSESDSMEKIMDQYKAISKNITVEEVDDLTDRIDLQQIYNVGEYDSLILVSSGDEEKVLTSGDLISYDYTTYQEVDLTEEAVTNAIVNVTAEDKPKVYFMDNHTLYDIAYYQGIIETLEGDANEVKAINLLSKGRVPEDCDTLVITTLKEDINEIEKNYITDYINDGGNILVLSGPNVTGIKLNNFYEILSLYGITYDNGIILEGDENKMLSGYPDFIIEDFGYSSITGNKDLKLKAYFTDAGAINVEEDEEELESLGVEYETLLSTSETAFLRTNLNISTGTRTDLDKEEKEYKLGVLATKTLEDEKTSKMVIYSDEVFDVITIQYISVAAGNNKDVVANSVAYLNKKDNTITIRKNFDQVTYTATQKEHDIIMTIIFVTPFAIIVLGIVVWIIRKRKK